MGAAASHIAHCTKTHHVPLAGGVDLAAHEHERVLLVPGQRRDAQDGAGDEGGAACVCGSRVSAFD